MNLNFLVLLDFSCDTSMSGNTQSNLNCHFMCKLWNSTVEQTPSQIMNDQTSDNDTSDDDTSDEDPSEQPNDPLQLRIIKQIDSAEEAFLNT